MPRVVVADDDRDIRELVVAKLELAGHEVFAAQNGTEALAKLREDGADLAVLDISMPGLSGVELCKILRSESATAGLPIILLTARAQEHDEEQGVIAGANEYIVKPFSPRALLNRVDALLESSIEHLLD